MGALWQSLSHFRPSAFLFSEIRSLLYLNNNVKRTFAFFQLEYVNKLYHFAACEGAGIILQEDLMAFQGKVWKFGDDVNTDEIIPARYLSFTDPKKLAEHVMEDADPSFPQKVSNGDIIVAGKNFGCGSSREHAPVAIKGAGIACVIAAGFARIFYRNAFNMGLLILESPEASEKIREGDTIEINQKLGNIYNITTGESFKVTPIPNFMDELISNGGLIEHIKKSGAI